MILKINIKLRENFKQLNIYYSKHLSYEMVKLNVFKKKHSFWHHLKHRCNQSRNQDGVLNFSQCV